MAHSDIDPKAFEGRTIERMEAEAINIVRFFFTDGTATALEIEGFGNGLVGIVQCQECAKAVPVEAPSELVSERVHRLVARCIRDKASLEETLQEVGEVVARDLDRADQEALSSRKDRNEAVLKASSDYVREAFGAP